MPHCLSKATLVVYFPQGHLEYVALFPSLRLFPSTEAPTFGLQPQIICRVVHVQLIANKKNDEFVSMLLCFLNQSDDTDGRIHVTSTKYSIDKIKLPVKTAWHAWIHRSLQRRFDICYSERSRTSSPKATSPKEYFLMHFLVLFDRLAYPELLEVVISLRIDADMKQLTLLVSKVNVVLKDAEKKQVKDMAVTLWIDELQDVVDDAEDALDEFSTENLRCNLEAGSQAYTNLMQNMVSPLNPMGAVFFNMQFSSLKNSEKEIDDGKVFTCFR
ncbi:hypothetical protein JRO89_XS15G0032100 [Xanthoceras sorbifolium]|uniref:Disease resistance N-terminal domain-containing protein n=1 Tax=Xanthoceras sorbifolium TaxID=99658 RepID=A0ABQ8H0W9_9ROSI|nr:hypothetical protein JRO89_XS15G0032100 [Xanthoceras sorbifolium]